MVFLWLLRSHVILIISSSHSLFMNMLINIDNFRIHTTAMINLGCSTTILLIHIIPTELCNHVKKSTIKVKCIQVTISPVAELVCDITVGKKDSPSFDRVHICINDRYSHTVGTGYIKQSHG